MGRNAENRARGQVDRRAMIGMLGAVGAAILAGCSDSGDESAASGGSGGAGGAGGSGGTGGSGGASGATGGAGQGGAGQGGAGQGGAGQGGEAGQGGAGGGNSSVTRDWATGGTAAMTAAASYPDPFSGSSGSACTLTCTVTQGPCWAPTAPTRQDVSEEQPGIPMRLALRLVEADGCTPVAGAEVEIWHCNVKGIYSAKDVESLAFCTANDAEALKGYFFRGRAVSDSDGKLNFDSCFPGWYASRALHIHFVVRRSAHVGEHTTTNSTVISQFFFPEDLTASIFAKVAGYVDRGQPDTNLTTDTVIGSLSDKTPYILDYEQMSDGAMLAWKTIVISDTTSCGSTGGGMGMGGGGGPQGMGGGPPGMGGGPPGMGGGPPGMGGGPPGMGGTAGAGG